MARRVAAWAEWAAWICSWRLQLPADGNCDQKERTSCPLFFLGDIWAMSFAQPPSARLNGPLTRLDLSDSISVLLGPATPVDQ